MRVEPERKLFICLRVDNKIRDALRLVQPRDQSYVDGTDERYLIVLRSSEDKYIGKIVDGGTTAAGMDDIKRNVLSILNKVAPARYKEDEVKVLALDEGEPPPEEVPAPRGGESEEPPRGGYY